MQKRKALLIKLSDGLKDFPYRKYSVTVDEWEYLKDLVKKDIYA